MRSRHEQAAATTQTVDETQYTAKFLKHSSPKSPAHSTSRSTTTTVCRSSGAPGLTASTRSGRRSGFSSTSLPILDVPVPLVGVQLVDVLRFFDTLCPVAEQVIDVPKIVLEDIPARRLCHEPQLVEQLVDEPLPSFDDFDLVEEEGGGAAANGSWVSCSRWSWPFLLQGCGPGGGVLVDDRHIHCSVPVTMQRRFQQFFEFFVPQVQFLDRMVDITVVLWLQWQKTVEVPQLPWGRAMLCRQWIHILRQYTGDFWKKSGFLLVWVDSAPEDDSRPALWTFPCLRSWGRLWKFLSSWPRTSSTTAVAVFFWFC